MSSKFKSFLSFREKRGFITSNPKLKSVIDSYTFLEISEINESELNLKIADNIKESKIINIGHYEEQKYHYFVLNFKRTILIIKETRIKTLQRFLSNKEKLKICFLYNTKEVFDDINDKFRETTIQYDEIEKDDYFYEEINEINFNFYRIESENFQFDDIFTIIKSSISGYLIKSSYFSYNRIDEIKGIIKNKIKPREIKQNEIIELREIGTGNGSRTILCYHIEYEKLVVIKKYYSNNPEIEKLLKREIRNYEEISHPFIPKFYGTIKYDNLYYPVIEFINGNSVLDTDFSQFSGAEIFEIIIQMLLVINYLHDKHFIYRDLKPNNAMIDENKTLVLIDFDRMIKDDYIYDENVETAEFPSPFAAPEINSKNMSYNCDIYSIGKMIKFILNKSISVMKLYEKKNYFKCITNSLMINQN